MGDWKKRDTKAQKMDPWVACYGDTFGEMHH